MATTRPHSTCRCPGRGPSALTRREMLAASANGFGLLALSGLLAESAASPVEAERGTPAPHFAAKAKNVIFCFMDGGV